MRILGLAVAAVLAAFGCAASASFLHPAPAIHRQWTGCPAGDPGPGLRWGPLGGSANRLPRFRDDFRPVAVIVCTEEPQRRPDGGVDLVAAEYRGTDLTELLPALRLSDLPIATDTCPSDAAFPRWFALLDAHGRWVRPGTPTNGCGETRRQVLRAVRTLPLTVTRRHPVRELLSAQAAAAGCKQLANDRVVEFNKLAKYVTQDPTELAVPPDPITFSGPVRLCVYRVLSDQTNESLGDFVRGGVLSNDRTTALNRLLQAPRNGTPCAEQSTLFAQLTNAEDEFRDGVVSVQLDGCRQTALVPRTALTRLARSDPALVAFLSMP